MKNKRDISGLSYKEMFIISKFDKEILDRCQEKMKNFEKTTSTPLGNLTSRGSQTSIPNDKPKENNSFVSPNKLSTSHLNDISILQPDSNSDIKNDDMLSDKDQSNHSLLTEQNKNNSLEENHKLTTIPPETENSTFEDNLSTSTPKRRKNTVKKPKNASDTPKVKFSAIKTRSQLNKESTEVTRKIKKIPKSSMKWRSF